jgi:alanine dehydrogenase
VLALADKGWKEALKDDAGLRAGLNICNGNVTHPQVAKPWAKNTFRPSPNWADRRIQG